MTLEEKRDEFRKAWNDRNCRFFRSINRDFVRFWLEELRREKKGWGNGIFRQ